MLNTLICLYTLYIFRKWYIFLPVIFYIFYFLYTVGYIRYGLGLKDPKNIYKLVSNLCLYDLQPPKTVFFFVPVNVVYYLRINIETTWESLTLQNPDWYNFSQTKAFAWHFKEIIALVWQKSNV